MQIRILLMILFCALPIFGLRAQNSNVSKSANNTQVKRYTITSQTENNVYKQLFAIKTDLMLWGGLMPNLKIGTWTPNLAGEVYFAKRWSVQFGYAYANWDAINGSRELFAVSVGDLEARYWVKKTQFFDGFFVALYGKMGEYDVQKGMMETLRANTGSFWSAGAGLGWVQNISKHWAAEAQARAGCRSASDGLYDVENGHYYLTKASKNNKVDFQLRLSMMCRFGKTNRYL